MSESEGEVENEDENEREESEGEESDRESVGDVCPICLEECDSLMSLDCDHKYCRDCLVKYIREKVKRKERKIYCPSADCNERIFHNMTTGIIGNGEGNASLMRAYKKMWFKEDIKRRTIYSMCPECKEICEKERDSNKVYCSDCEDNFCYLCKDEHDDLGYETCPYREALNNELAEIEEAIKEEEGSDATLKHCPVCDIIIYKESGCNSVRCEYCETKFCWNCLILNDFIGQTNYHPCSDYGQFLAGS